MDFIETNSYYEGLIQNLYGGSKGVFSSFMCFFYQYNQCCVFSPENAHIYQTLYQKEIENCKILSELLIKMGGDNKYYSSARKFLSGGNVDYIKNVGKMFLLDIEIIETHIIDVRNIIAKIDNVTCKNQLKKILENKKQSLRFLKENYFKNNLI